MKQRVNSMKTVTFICNGNTCRSPMAEAMYKKYLKMHKIDNINVMSAGTSAFEGEKAHEKAVSLMNSLKIDISNHTAKRVDYDIINETDLFVCLTDLTADTMREKCDARKIISVDTTDPGGKDEKAYADSAKQIFDSFEMITNILSSLPEITQMAEGDIAAVAEIEKCCFSTPWSENSLREELTNPLARFYLLKMDEDIIGYIGAHNISGEVYITNIAVLPEYRGKGYAKKLLMYLCYMSEKENADFISLEVRKSNKAAISLYEKCGFEPVGERKGFYDNPKEDAIIYKM